MEEIDKKRAKLSDLLFAAKKLQREIAEDESVASTTRRKILDEEKCFCGHERMRHGLSTSINYTDGACVDCVCMHFVKDE